MSANLRLQSSNSWRNSSADRLASSCTTLSGMSCGRDAICTTLAAARRQSLQLQALLWSFWGCIWQLAAKKMAADAGKLQKHRKTAPMWPETLLKPLWKIRKITKYPLQLRLFSHNFLAQPPHILQKVRLFSPILRYVFSPLGKMNFSAMFLNFSAMFWISPLCFRISPVSQFGSSFVGNFKVNPRRYGLERPTSLVQALPSALNPACTHSIPIISLRTKYPARSPSAETSQVLRGCLQARSLSCAPEPPHSCPSELWGLSAR